MLGKLKNWFVKLFLGNYLGKGLLALVSLTSAWLIGHEMGAAAVILDKIGPDLIEFVVLVVSGLLTMLFGVIPDRK